jgi:hypothetical protein
MTPNVLFIVVVFIIAGDTVLVQIVYIIVLYFLCNFAVQEAILEAIRECHGLANLHGSRVWVAMGAGAGCKIPTRGQPSPAAWVTQTRCGFAIGVMWISFF